MSLREMFQARTGLSSHRIAYLTAVWTIEGCLIASAWKDPSLGSGFVATAGLLLSAVTTGQVLNKKWTSQGKTDEPQAPKAEGKEEQA